MKFLSIGTAIVGMLFMLTYFIWSDFLLIWCGVAFEILALHLFGKHIHNQKYFKDLDNLIGRYE